MFASEPVVIIGIIISFLQIIQASVLSISPALHAIIAVVVVILGTIVARGQVSPVK